MSEHMQEVVLKPRNEGESLKVAEAVLRRRKEPKSDRIGEFRDHKRQLVKSTRKIGLITAQSMIKKYRNNVLDRQRISSLNKKSNHTPREDYKLLIVLRNIRPVSSKESKVLLKKLGLEKAFLGVLMANSPKNLKLLRIIEPFVFYGTPNLLSLSTLMHKAAYLKVKGSDLAKKRQAISDNRIIEDKFGHLGLLCVEDVIDLLWKGEVDGDESLNVFLRELAPFEFANLRTVEGVDARRFESGFLGVSINEKLSKIL